MEEARTRLIQAFANLGTMISVIVALVALMINVSRNTERAEKTQQLLWQKSSVYEIIRDKPGLTLKEVGDYYVIAATRYGLPKLSNDALQDQELNRVLLTLLEAHTVIMDENSRYFPVVGLSIDEEIKQRMLGQLKINERALEVRGKVLSVLETENGKYTIDQLYRVLEERGINVPFDMFVNIITDLRPAYILKGDDNLLYATFDVSTDE